jgi:RNA polymerase sigma-70 factor, ECF subfamily
MEDAAKPPEPAAGRFEARYLAFLETIRHLRPRLHRYCSRMLGSVIDGEDVVQDSLFQAYRRLDAFDPERPLAPWLFRIAHNRCIDVLRRRETRKAAEREAAAPVSVEPVDPPGRALGRAVEHLVLALPPKERACVLLKDVFDYSLEEIASLVDSTVGGVKAALNRGRTKLATLREEPSPSRAPNVETSRLLHLYVDRFNRRDWDGLRALISADATVTVADRFAGRLADAPYFGTYERWPTEWLLGVGAVDGVPVIVIHYREAGGWTPYSIVRLEASDQRIFRIVDYLLCPWVLQAAFSIVVADLPEPPTHVSRQSGQSY